MSKHQVGDMVLCHRYGVHFVGIITNITETPKDPWSNFLYKVEWSDDDWWNYREEDINKFKKELQKYVQQV
jgi:hypothetical protein